jgi:Txe/YoeB family toxin of Txe-Axe toxin-antitoxin module
MQIVLLGKSEKDLKAWKEAGNIAVLKKIRKLLKAIQQEPYPLKNGNHNSEIRFLLFKNVWQEVILTNLCSIILQ